MLFIWCEDRVNIILFYYEETTIYFCLTPTLGARRPETQEGTSLDQPDATFQVRTKYFFLKFFWLNFSGVFPSKF